MLTVTTIFVVGFVMVGLVTAMSFFSLFYYIRAKEIAPHLLEKERLLKEIEEAQTTVSELNKARNDLLEEKQEALTIIADSKEGRKWLKENKMIVDNLKYETEQQKIRLREATENMTKRQAELDELTQKVSDKNTELHNSEKIKSELDVEIARMHREKSMLASESATLQKTVNELGQEMEHRQSRQIDLISEVRGLENRVNILKEQLQSLKKDHDNLLNEIVKKTEELDSIIAHVNNLKDKNNSLLADNSLLSNTLESLNKQIDSETKKAARLENNIESLVKSRNELDAHVSDLKRSAEKYNELIKSSKQEHSQAVESLKKMREEEAELEGKANAGRRVLAELISRQESSTDRWRDLDAPLITLSGSPKPSDIKELEWLNEFADRLEKSDIRFSERSIKAFHTGLKCADISSLVVLAGISGTGKSLLPELYAAALGMNFLPMAVQPRWDSPQDLFGFYNYMEGRYKATELARLLWQFDRYNNSAAKSLFKNQMSMNLVLLDEMNLARVEYYFSDLLSKLEIRSGVNPYDVKQRQAAEIEIESAAILDKKSHRRLFVDKNTLFVGTMNEDESTQSLSDKVLDRANVLRFGRPEKLDAKPDKQRFKASYDGRKSITEANWIVWKESFNQSFIDDMRKLLQEVNPALDEVGRPYAYRVAQAMESYVGYYPGTNNADFSAAVADQIEMKILPKLNGLELDMPGFEKVKNVLNDVINNLEDDKLQAAFNKSCDQSGNNAFFKWHGVTR